MKKVSLLFGASALILVSCVGNPEGKKAETTDSVETVSDANGTQLNVDTAQSTVKWLGKKVTGQHDGTVKITSGTLTVKDGKLSGGRFTIDLTTINNNDLEGEYKQKLENHLRSADFFDVENHPEATFEITSIADGANAGTLTVSGNLTIRGVTKNITFDATASQVSEVSVVADADFNIAREDWGVSYKGQADDLISKEINFKIHLVAGN